MRGLTQEEARLLKLLNNGTPDYEATDRIYAEGGGTQATASEIVVVDRLISRGCLLPYTHMPHCLITSTTAAGKLALMCQAAVDNLESGYGR